MADFLEVAHSLALQHQVASAISIFTSTIFIGEITALVASFLAWNNAIAWPVLFVSLVGGAIAGNMVWYEFGRWLRGSPFGSWVTGKFRYHEILERQLHENPRHIIFVSNLVSGISFSAIILAGWSRVPYRTFIRAAIFSGVVWTLVFFAVGFFASSAIGYLRTSEYVKRAELVLLAFIVLIFLIQHLARRSVTKKLKKIS